MTRDEAIKRAEEWALKAEEVVGPETGAYARAQAYAFVSQAFSQLAQSLPRGPQRPEGFPIGPAFHTVVRDANRSLLSWDDRV